ncbi:MAG: hypothetical protein J5680_04525 [Neisseriaceae bacterium]|nr:hypothetical protein [Neisseriaceae bacterium]
MKKRFLINALIASPIYISLIYFPLYIIYANITNSCKGGDCAHVGFGLAFSFFGSGLLSLIFKILAVIISWIKPLKNGKLFYFFNDNATGFAYIFIAYLIFYCILFFLDTMDWL